jgi:hypothetical protein
MSASPWKTEAEMVADFTEWVKSQGWVAYAETAGWDILLVRPADGFQIGVEAKLALNLTVVSQCLDRSDGFGKVGPDCRAVLVPEAKLNRDLERIAHALSIAVIKGRERSKSFPILQFMPRLPELENNIWRDAWPERCPEVRHPLPEYVPDVTGGRPSPVQLTEWKIKAIKAAILLEARGSISRADLQALGLSPARWVNDWLKPNGKGEFVAGPFFPDFKAQHPRNWEQIDDDFAKWAPPRQK